jgi:hypothetical protein
MFFTIEAYKFILGMNESFRLKRDLTWSVQKDFHLYNKNEDMLFETIEEAIAWLNTNTEVNIDGEIVSTKPKTSFKAGDDRFHFEVILHREECPEHIFTKDELRNVLLNGDDNKNNVLIVNLQGYFKLINRAELTYIRKYPVRYETFCSGNHYVGYKLEENLINNIYCICLEAWLMHLKTGRSIYKDYLSKELTEVELLKEIKGIYSELEKIKANLEV